MRACPREVLKEIEREYFQARVKFRPLASTHEAYAVIKEEFEEFWDEVKRDDVGKQEKELRQCAAMCFAALVECFNEKSCNEN